MLSVDSERRCRRWTGPSAVLPVTFAATEKRAPPLCAARAPRTRSPP
ncbi:hypothetical protein ACRAWD_21260 [Caulobacter segnis]